MLDAMPYTLEAATQYESIIKKSRFIACVEPVTNRLMAQQKIHQLKLTHPGAAHVCWALIAGGQSAAVDDGEPSGTAGKPMLEVLRHQQLDGVMASVVRYFGGVKLGSGGLVRAYTDAVAQALQHGKRITLQRFTNLECQFPYALEGAIRRALAAYQAELQSASHDALVQMRLKVPDDLVPAFISHTNAIGQGSLVWVTPKNPVQT